MEKSAGNSIRSLSNLQDYTPVPLHLPDSPWQLGNYLAGLIEGDGYFGSQRLEIVFHEKDTFLAYRLRTMIGFGSIYKVLGKRACKLSIGSRAGFERIHELCNGKFVGSYKVEQFNKNIYGLTLSPPLNKVSLETSWLAGFFDADGSLAINIQKSSTHKLGLFTQLTLRISQAQKPILQLIQDALPKAHIHFSDNCYRLGITHREEGLRLLVEYFDHHHLRSTKYLEYIYWRKAFVLMDRKEHLTKEGLDKIRVWKVKIEKIRE